MRTPGAGIDPRIMIGDMSSDGIGYAVDRMKLVRELMNNLLGRYEEEGADEEEREWRNPPRDYDYDVYLLLEGLAYEFPEDDDVPF